MIVVLLGFVGWVRAKGDPNLLVAYGRRALELLNSTSSRMLNPKDYEGRRHKGQSSFNKQADDGLQAHKWYTQDELYTLREEKQKETKKLAFLMHHKSGTHLGDALIAAIHLESSEYIRDTHFPSRDDRDSTFLPWKVSDSFEHLFYNNSINVLHFVRDPWNILVSAYNYHMSASEVWLLWENTSSKYCSEIYFADCLRSLNLEDGIVANTKFMLAEIRDMVKGYQVFQRWPDRAINICMTEWKSNFEGTVIRVCDFIGHDRCAAEDVKETILKWCKEGYCNIHVPYNEDKIECRPIKVIGNCESDDALQQCLWNHEITNVKTTDATCCDKSRLYTVNCYSKPKFKEASLSDVRKAIISKDPLVFKELELWSKLMGCHNTN